jgi:hypothetical protein
MFAGAWPDQAKMVYPRPRIGLAREGCFTRRIAAGKRMGIKADGRREDRAR